MKAEQAATSTDYMTKTLNDWLAHLERLHPTTIELGLDRVRDVASRLDLDTGNSRVVIVGGTNGKGSTVTLLAEILKAAGRTTACYMSPHITYYNERVLLDGQMASDETLCNAFAEVEAARQGVSLTYFEFGTLCAMVVFARHRPDWIIYEVGLGGRLDAVNIAEPDISILTNVALDHMDWLGDTREKIGFEKAGIFRPGKPAIYGEADMPASVAAQAASLQAPVYQQGRAFLWSRSSDGTWSWQGSSAAGEKVSRFSLPATRVNLDNAACALQALTLLEPTITEAAIHKGLEVTRLEGRFEQLSDLPAVVVDVAHNTHAVDNLIEQLDRQFPGRSLHIVIAMLADKDSREAVRRLSAIPARWYVGQLAGERGASSKILYNHLRDWGVATLSQHDSVNQAFDEARRQAGSDDVILVTGSFLTVSAVKGMLADD